MAEALDVRSILVADDHAVLRESVADRISREPDLSVVAQAADCRSLLEALRNHEPDVALVDVSMPGGTGIHVIREARDEGIPTRFIVLTMHQDSVMFEAALAAGAVGYLTKTASPDEIITAVRGVSLGGQSWVASLRATERNAEAGRVAKLLSPREVSVLEHIARGYTSKEIAEALGLSPATVDTYRSRICGKLGTKSRPELVQVALDAGLLR